MDIAPQSDGTFMVAGRRFPNKYEAADYLQTLQEHAGPPLVPAAVEPPGVGAFLAVLAIPLAAVVVGLGLSGAGSPGMGAIVFILGAIAFYVAPAWVAHKAQHPQRTAITILSILLGWTVIGWIVCIVWAFGRQRAPDLVPVQSNQRAVAAPSANAEVAAAAAQPAEKTCPFCAETIKAAAIRCKHCGSDLSSLPQRAITG